MDARAQRQAEVRAALDRICRQLLFEGLSEHVVLEQLRIKATAFGLPEGTAEDSLRTIAQTWQPPGGFPGDSK